MHLLIHHILILVIVSISLIANYLVAYCAAKWGPIGDAELDAFVSNTTLVKQYELLLAGSNLVNEYGLLIGSAPRPSLLLLMEWANGVVAADGSIGIDHLRVSGGTGSLGLLTQTASVLLNGIAGLPEPTIGPSHTSHGILIDWPARASVVIALPYITASLLMGDKEWKYNRAAKGTNHANLTAPSFALSTAKPLAIATGAVVLAGMLHGDGSWITPTTNSLSVGWPSIALTIQDTNYVGAGITTLDTVGIVNPVLHKGEYILHVKEALLHHHIGEWTQLIIHTHSGELLRSLIAECAIAMAGHMLWSRAGGNIAMRHLSVRYALGYAWLMSWPLSHHLSWHHLALPGVPLYRVSATWTQYVGNEVLYKQALLNALSIINILLRYHLKLITIELMIDLLTVLHGSLIGRGKAGAVIKPLLPFRTIVSKSRAINDDLSDCYTGAAGYVSKNGVIRPR